MSQQFICRMKGCKYSYHLTSNFHDRTPSVSNVVSKDSLLPKNSPRHLYPGQQFETFEVGDAGITLVNREAMYWGWFGEEPRFGGEENEIRFSIERVDGETIFVGNAMYVPEELRGQGLAKHAIEVQEKIARENGCTKMRRTPGNRNGAVFWTRQGYEWESPPIHFTRELSEMSRELKQFREDPSGKIYMKDGFRFEHVLANIESLSENEKLMKFLEEVESFHEERTWDRKDDPERWFTAADVLALDDPIYDEVTGSEMTVGELIMTNSGGWHAWKVIGDSD